MAIRNVDFDTRKRMLIRPSNGSVPNRLSNLAQGVARRPATGVGALSSQIEVSPGAVIRISELRLRYRGLGKSIILGVAWKGSAGFLRSVDFNNGGGVLSKAGAQAFYFLSIPRQEVETDVSISVPVGQVLVVPDIGDHPTRAGGSLKINEGPLDAWVWLVDRNKVGASPSFSTLMNEANFVTLSFNDGRADRGAIDTDSGVVNIGTVAAPTPVSESVGAFEVRYAKSLSGGTSD